MTGNRGLSRSVSITHHHFGMSTTRQDLIERKQQVIAQIAATRRELERVRTQPDRASQRRAQTLDTQLTALMAKEQQLRLAIDRSRA